MSLRPSGSGFFFLAANDSLHDRCCCSGRQPLSASSPACLSSPTSTGSQGNHGNGSVLPRNEASLPLHLASVSNIQEPGNRASCTSRQGHPQHPLAEGNFSPGRDVELESLMGLLTMGEDQDRDGIASSMLSSAAETHMYIERDVHEQGAPAGSCRPTRPPWHEAWHEVHALSFTDPITGKQVALCGQHCWQHDQLIPAATAAKQLQPH